VAGFGWLQAAQRLTGRLLDVKQAGAVPACTARTAGATAASTHDVAFCFGTGVPALLTQKYVQGVIGVAAC
jgi:hypothetical protein